MTSPSAPPPQPPPHSSSPFTPAFSPPPPPPSSHMPSTSSSAPPSPSTSSFSWNSLLRFLAFSPTPKPLNLSLFLFMLLHSSPPPDSRSFSFILKAYAHLFSFRLGSQNHSYILKLGFSSDTFIANSLMHFYITFGLLQLARMLFDDMPNRTQVSWNVMIDGYSITGDYNTTLYVLREMQLQFFMPDVYTVQSLLSASGGLGALSIGIWAHAFLIKRLDSRARIDIMVNNSLVDLYARCGSLSMARQVFEGMPERDVASWNTMILRLASHGRIKECFFAFNVMVKEDNLRPNSITLVALLSACNHGGLVKEGLQYFHLFTDQFGIEARLEHFGCLVNLLARAGLVDEAIDCVQRMPCKPDAVIWRSLLDACWKRRTQVEISESVAFKALESDAEEGDSGVYVLLSKVYASANRWNEVGLVRKLMAEEGIKKEPGCSSLEINGIVHEFVAGDTSHPKSEEIYKKLEEVEKRISVVGYEIDPMEAPLIAGRDEVKRDCLRLHSERLAMAFGLMNMSFGTPMRILKNLRVCGDCHNVTKLISVVYDVEIILRDRLRFHYFKDGSCSCMDYW
ncbi:pentatricopeptide repeat-containing protein At1g59720, chloroplastic/mitochondrial [Dendrobium catenatum]|uniref:pentatricopeptide repeat-containing protein At1g59720, chloroplastic/mitochondrial n=1 Tax=Dendrobium catenatum TaxID=906689 RepID=UPI0009F544FC|nr:pentatricopeptide repeat-containing protein At1g59720, chloroplastic/mitochondrial [Dendrobium catenatum]